MSIRSSIFRRIRLARGFSPGEGLRVIIGDREFRRQVKLGVIWGREPVDVCARGLFFRFVHAGLSRRLTDIIPDRNRRYTVIALASDLLDHEWYAETHELPRPEAALVHFLLKGMSRGYAPARAFARPGDIRLSGWGRQILLRIGLPLGPFATASDPRDDPHERPGRARDLDFGAPTGRKLAIVTASFDGRVTWPQIDPAWAERADFFLITDRPVEASAPWKPVMANYHHFDPRRQLAWYKTHLPQLFAGYDWVMWTDGRVSPQGEPSELLDSFGPSELIVCRTPGWQRLPDGIVEAFQSRAEPPGVLGAHLELVAGHPAFARSPLLDTSLFFLRPSAPATWRLSGRWWSYIARGAADDALSLPLAMADTQDLVWRELSAPAAEMDGTLMPTAN